MSFALEPTLEKESDRKESNTTKIFPPKSTGMMKAFIFVGIQEKLTQSYDICLEICLSYLSSHFNLEMYYLQFSNI